MAALSSVYLTLYTGPSQLTLAPLEIAQALQSVEVTCTQQAPSGFQLTFGIENDGALMDYPLVANSLLQPWSRIALVVTLNGIPTVLMDGYITGQELSPGSASGGSTLTVTGEDVSVKMDLFEISLEWPAMGDFLIAEAVLLKYLILGISSNVQPTVTDLIPFGYVPQQNCTDRCYLQQLATQNGYLFYVVPGPTVGANTAYWGPPIRTGTPQSALSVNMGPFTNVESIGFHYNALAPAINYGLVQVENVPVPVYIGASSRSPALATEPALDDYSGLAANPLGYLDDLVSLQIRGTLLQHQGLGLAQAYVVGQAQTDVSTDEVVTAEGTLDSVRYGSLLNVPGLVAVRGAGMSYDGVYMVKQVTHSISTRLGDWDYKQKFTLIREGMGSTITSV